MQRVHVETGMRIGRYRIGSLINKGGMGMVFKAEETLANGSSRNVAIKFLRLSVIHDRAVIDGFFQEAFVMSKLRSSYIPKVLDWGVWENLPYIVMEYIVGVNLLQLLDMMRAKGICMGFDVAAYILREVGHALTYVHSLVVDGVALNILHRDVSAKNVMVDNTGSVFLIDFGIMRASLISPVQRTGSNVLKGTLQYLAPEHARGSPCVASDIFGHHTILWEMVAGKRFREGKYSSWGDVLDGRIPPVARPGVPSLLLELLARGLHPDPEKRITLSVELPLLAGAKDCRIELKALVAKFFSRVARVSGSTKIVDFRVPKELLDTAAAAKAVGSVLGVPKFEVGQMVRAGENTSDGEGIVEPASLEEVSTSADALPIVFGREEDERPPSEFVQIDRPAQSDQVGPDFPATEVLPQPDLGGPQRPSREPRGGTLPFMPACAPPVTAVVEAVPSANIELAAPIADAVSPAVPTPSVDVLSPTGPELGVCPEGEVRRRPLFFVVGPALALAVVLGLAAAYILIREPSSSSPTFEQVASVAGHPSPTAKVPSSAILPPQLGSEQNDDHGGDQGPEMTDVSISLPDKAAAKVPDSSGAKPEMSSPGSGVNAEPSVAKPKKSPRGSVVKTKARRLVSVTLRLGLATIGKVIVGSRKQVVLSDGDQTAFKISAGRHPVKWEVPGPKGMNNRRGTEQVRFRYGYTYTLHLGAGGLRVSETEVRK